MTICSISSPANHSLDQLRARFLTILPRIERHGRVYFRHVKCPAKKSDFISEMVALCWKWIVRLAERGKDGFRFPMMLATFAAKQVKCGRRLAGQDKAKDAMSPVAQHRHGFQVESLPISTRVSWEQIYGGVGGQRLTDECEERLRDNTRTPPDEQAAFRIDWPAWLCTRTERDRRIIDQMALGERTKHLSHKFGISPARVSQLRREYHDDWVRFTGDKPSDGVSN